MHPVAYILIPFIILLIINKIIYDHSIKHPMNNPQKRKQDHLRMSHIEVDQLLEDVLTNQE